MNTTSVKNHGRELGRLENSRQGSSAKFIVCGEYAVLENSSCIAYPLKELRMHVGAKAGNLVATSEQTIKFLELSKKMGLDYSTDALPQINSTIPLGAGFGSSAALCVELAKQKDPEADPFKLFRMAKEGENIFHGNSSGVDPACIAFEKPIIYKRNPSEIRILRVHENFNDSFWILRHSGENHATSEGVKACTEHPDWNSICATIEESCKRTIKALEHGDLELLLKSLKTNSSALEKLGCNSAKVQEKSNELIELGSKVTKITGSGFGGYVLGWIDRAELQKNRAFLKKNDLIITFSGNDETREWTSF